ncbi:MAG TPA: hypothetical protein VKA37_12185 [Halobacteriales archaeon]|nr:hypothetical protein [Halobacteriales archaeon]
MEVNTNGPVALSRQLTALKRRGCNVLVVNDAPGAEPVCRALLGAAGLDRRYVFVPTTTSVADALARCTLGSVDPDRLGVVDASTAGRTRSATISAGPAAAPDPDAVWYSEVADLRDLPTVLRQAGRHLERLTPPDPGPGDVRFCLESLDPFFDEVSTDHLLRFVHLLTATIRRLGGLGHFHVAAGTADHDVRVLEPLFDATVTVRADDELRAHRWTIHETGYETDWLPLDGLEP